MPLISDVRAAIASLSAARGFTAIVVLTLGAALALSLTIFTVVNAYVVRELPYPAADRLYRVDYGPPNQSPPRGMADLDWSSLSDIVEHQIAWDLDMFYILGQQYPEAVPGGWVTPGYIEGFGVRVARGRLFDAREYQPDSPAVALISHRLWQTHFGGDEGVLGRTFNAYVSDRPEGAETFTIVGVLAPDLWHLNVYSEVLVPLAARAYPYMMRLRAGVPPSTAAARIDALVRQSVTNVPATFNVVLTSSHESYIGAIRPVLWSVSAAAALVLMIAGANVAVLMLVRASRREQEIAIRLALGATPARLARLLALEGVLLGTVSAAIGLGASAAIVPRLGYVVQQVLERRVPGGLDALTVDGTVAAAGALAAVALAIVFAVVPLPALRRASLATSLASAARSTASAASARSRAAFVAVEVAASFTLILGAVLMARTALHMLEVEFGFDDREVVTASLALRERSYPDAAAQAAFFDRLTDRTTGIAGSTSFALGDWWPLQGSRPRRVQSAGPDAIIAGANPFAVSDGYFGTLGMRMIDGRAFARQDRLGSEPVAIVSRSLAGRLWPERRAVGELLTIALASDSPPVTVRVVGVINDVRQSHTDNDPYDVYLPIAQHPSRFAFLYLRGPLAPGWEHAIRSAVAAVDPEVAVGTPRPLARGLEEERARPRFLAGLLSAFAAVACVLALVGMHGVIAYAVRQREREIAIRIAVGANRTRVTGLFVRQGLLVLAAGLLAGVFGALALGRILEHQLFNVRPNEPAMLAAAALAFAFAGLAAIAWPSWRAASTDPVQILRSE